MSKTMPRKALRMLINEAQQTMAEQPDAEVELIIRGTYDADKKGELVFGVQAAAPSLSASPISAELAADLRREWWWLGNGEFVLRVARRPRSDS